MSETIEHLKLNSRLPGPRGNLELLHSFARRATPEEIEECIAHETTDLHNSPEEFVVMCGIVARSLMGKNDAENTLETIRRYASHGSWRIREAVAIGIQEMVDGNFGEIVRFLTRWLDGNALEKRAVIAGLCEPKLLKDPHEIATVIGVLEHVTLSFEAVAGRLSDGQKSLRKTLGYGWSVAIVSDPDIGKPAFAKLARIQNTHISWIVRENLKKNRLRTIDEAWVQDLVATAG